MSYEEKFHAAVNVIRNLPKNGAYQPSHELMLRFYAYYKQATEGPNTSPKPNFWEVVKKAKWDAWAKLGNMSREQAMISYVEELKKIVETMAYNDNVADFITSLDSFYESVPAEDLQMLIGPVIDKVRSQPGSPLSNSPLGSREASPQRISTKPTPSKRITSSLETSPASSYSGSPSPHHSNDEGEEEEENFLDTFEQTEPERCNVKETTSILKNDINYKALNGSAVIISSERKDRSRFRDRMLRSDERGDQLSVESTAANINRYQDISEIISQTSFSLQKNLDTLTLRVNEVDNKCRQLFDLLEETKTRKWSPLLGVPIPSAIFFLIWPLIIQVTLSYVRRHRRRL